MAKRRANGEGKLRKRDGRWEGRYTTEHAPGTDKAIYRDVLGRIQEETKKVGSTLWGLPSLTSGFMSHNGVLHILRRVLMLLEVCKVRFYNLHRTFVTLTLQRGWI